MELAVRVCASRVVFVPSLDFSTDRWCGGAVAGSSSLGRAGSNPVAPVPSHLVLESPEGDTIVQYAYIVQLVHGSTERMLQDAVCSRLSVSGTTPSMILFSSVLGMLDTLHQLSGEAPFRYLRSSFTETRWIAEVSHIVLLYTTFPENQCLTPAATCLSK